MLTGLRLGAPSSRSPRWRGRPLVVPQIALAVVLVVGAVAAANQFRTIANLPLGFSPEQFVVMDVNPHFRTPEEGADFFRRALAAGGGIRTSCPQEPRVLAPSTDSEPSKVAAPSISISPSSTCRLDFSRR